jgi:hypothetical protein
MIRRAAISEKVNKISEGSILGWNRVRGVCGSAAQGPDLERRKSHHFAAEPPLSATP